MVEPRGSNLNFNQEAGSSITGQTTRIAATNAGTGDINITPLGDVSSIDSNGIYTINNGNINTDGYGTLATYLK